MRIDLRWDLLYVDRKSLKDTLELYAHAREGIYHTGLEMCSFTLVVADIETAMDKLTSEERQCVLLKCVLGLSETEVGDRLSLPKRRVNYVIQTALDKMLMSLNDCQGESHESC